MTVDNQSAAERGGQQIPSEIVETAKMAGVTDVVEKGIISDFVTQLATHPDATAAASVGLAARAGLKVVNNAITQRGETRREELRQQGETERARIAQQPSQNEPPASS